MPGEIRQKELWETLDTLVAEIPHEGSRAVFRKLLFDMSSNAVTHEVQARRDLVRRWLRTNDPTGSYR